ncbi:MAG: peptide chain release factor N(5)-glutamine methyltransferase [Verrucomicrobiota bacterium]
MQSVMDILRKTTGYFEQKGVPEARLNAERLIAHVLGCSRLELYLQFERPLTNLQLDQLRPLVSRRGRREPLQYILGDTEFYGMTLKCDRRALIPRPETEELVEALAENFKSSPPGNALDLGTGTGALALALARVWPEAAVTAADLSKDALALAAENAALNELTERVNLVTSDWFEAIDPQRFDLIVSNPPYLTREEMGTAEPEVVQFEPESALVSGNDGLDDLRKIIADSINYLNEGALLAMETGIAQHEVLADLVTSAGFKRGESRNDLSERPRFFWAWA